MEEGIQTFFKIIGDCGCYVLTLIKFAENYTGKKLDCIEVIRHALFNEWLDEDMFVRDPAAILKVITGARWEVTKALSPSEEPGTFNIERWERVTTKETLSHFKLPDWDSLENSQTVKFGKIVSYRVLRRIV